MNRAHCDTNETQIALRRLFERHASVTIENQKYLNENDFIAAIVHDEDSKIKKEQYALLFKIADRKNRGLVSWTEFLVFEDILSKPDAEYELAFKLFDPTGKGTVNFGQFRKILEESTALPIDFSSDWFKLFFGKDIDDSKEIKYEEFTELLKGLQGERIRQEFRHYDRDGTGQISPQSFKRLMAHIAKHKLSDKVIQHLPTVANVYSGNSVTYANVIAFYNVLRDMDLVERIVREAVKDSKDGSITKADFTNVGTRLLRFAMFTPMEVDILFHFAGLENKSGRLTLDDFGKLLDPTFESKQKEKTKATTEVTEPRRSASALVQTLKSAYAFVLGSIAGAVGAFSIYPIDLVKTRMQNQRSAVVGELLYKNSLDCFRKVIKTEGFLGLYSGLGPQLVGVAPEKAIKLTMNDFVRSQFIDRETGKIALPAEILAGCVAGGSQVIFTNPLEIVKIRLQVQGEMAKEVGAAGRQSAMSIVRSLGIVGLYKGAGACLLRDIPFSGIYFTAYAHLKKDVFHESPTKKLSIGELLSAGAVAGMPAAYLTTPADVIKTRLQVEAKKGQTTYNGIMDAAGKIYREEGFKAFFKGGPARIFRSSPQFGVTLMTYELLQQTIPFPLDTPSTKPAISPKELAYIDSTFIKSKNAIKILMDIDTKFGVLPTTHKMPSTAQ
ncbi:mitochondrial carrier domain-containing protein [Paraphysoderma sedebokerense]|nr:mitochondrial carrier domain-containing protein [Paraphysoderma sedebokerense]